MSGHTWPMYLALYLYLTLMLKLELELYLKCCLPLSDAGAGLMAPLPIFTFIRRAPMFVGHRNATATTATATTDI